MLRTRLDAEVEQARLCAALDDEAQPYLVVLDEGVRLFANESARAALPVIGALALLPCLPPRRSERERALVAPGTRDA